MIFGKFPGHEKPLESSNHELEYSKTIAITIMSWTLARQHKEVYFSTFIHFPRLGWKTATWSQGFDRQHARNHQKQATYK